jgi:peptidoglycan/xylan/chitin deacetylase (PgdA/CDA1 family)
MIRTVDGAVLPPILYYHRIAPGVHPGVGVEPSEFSRQMRFLKRLGYEGVSLRDANEAMDNRKKIVITFDDGYLDNFQHAGPILQDNGYRATIFCVSKKTGSVSDWTTDPVWSGLPLMDKGQLRELHRLGFEIGSHSRTHPDLSRIPLPEAREEIEGSRRDLEDLLGSPVDTFCYPYGAFSKSAIELVREAGYRYARSVLRMKWGARYGRHLLPCRSVSGKMPFFRFAGYGLLYRAGF